MPELLIDRKLHIPVADPGFPQGGGANSRGGGPTYNFAKFSQKLHGIERILTWGGWHLSLAPSLDLPLYSMGIHALIFKGSS